MRNIVVLLLLLLLIAAGAAWSREAAPVSDDPQLESRVMALAEDLRCLVCQNQSLADSHAELAIDLKNQIRDKMKQGVSDADITAYMVERYGDFVLYRPPLKATTLTLWFGPFLLLAAGLALLFYRLARKRAAPGERELTDSERSRAAVLLAVVEKGEHR